jgi:hypothetical protein
VGERPAAQVAVEDYLAVVRVYADRVHDFVRRTGCPPAVAAEIVEATALELLVALVEHPLDVVDMAGWWFRQAGRAAERDNGAPTADRPRRRRPAGRRGTRSRPGEGDEQVGAALDRLTGPQRTAVLLRDAYDLPPEPVAVALGVDRSRAAELVARGRLAFLAGYEGVQPPPLGPHPARPTVDLPTLSRLADGTLPIDQAAPLRRHLRDCAACAATADALHRARRVLAEQPVLAIDAVERERMLDRIRQQAEAVLPGLAELLLDDGGRTGRPPVSPILAVAAVVLALVLGSVTGALLAPRAGARPTAAPLTSLSPTPSASTRPPPRRTPSASTSPSGTPTPTGSSPTPTSPTPSTSSPALGPVTLTLDPASGPNGQTVTVTGTGWLPGVPVQLAYTNALGATGARSSAVPNAAGRFVTQIAAEDPAFVPGRHTVTATNGRQSASAQYAATD